MLPSSMLPMPATWGDLLGELGPVFRRRWPPPRPDARARSVRSSGWQFRGRAIGSLVTGPLTAVA
jgi:hypothetical protein